MKNLTKAFIYLLIATATVSCKKEEEPFIPGTQTSSQDNNKMTTVMREMVTNMDSMDRTGNPDQRFAKMMIIHHQAAIDLSNIALAEGTDPTLRSLANTMIETQNQEISAFTSFINNNPTAQPASPSFNAKMDILVDKLRRSPNSQNINGNIDHDFAIVMIAHHQSAIEMADLILQAGSDAMLADLVKKMKENQEAEIKKLQNWLLG
jgi:uncharacterized protein (DUF305 family)